MTKYIFMRHIKDNKIYWDYPDQYKYDVKHKITDPKDYELYKKMDISGRLKDININGLIELFNLQQFRKISN